MVPAAIDDAGKTTTTTMVDAASVSLFRAAFGLLMFVATIRFAWRGWIDEILAAPTFHFTFSGFAWVRPLPQPWLNAQYVVMALAALCIGLGVRVRVAAGVFFVLFTWAELVEKAAYLNHYFFVSIVALLLAIVRTDHCFALLPEQRSVDDHARIDARWLWLFRGQIVCVYFFAGLAKVDSDWLLHAEPLRIWLQDAGGWPVVGSLMTTTAVAHAMSIAGCLFDLSIWAFIVWPRTRVVAYVVAVVFHLTVWQLFPIGLFSPVMLVSATVLFSPSWPRRFLRRPSPPPSSVPGEGVRTSWPTVFVAVWLAAQVLLPLRHYAIPGVTNWTEQGFRFAWRVMLIEKTGTVEYRVVGDDAHGNLRYTVFPGDELTKQQHRQMRTQPDMILQYAHHLRDVAAARGEGVVRVYADAWASLNGRRAQRLIDPAVDLASVDDTLLTVSAAPWIVPLTTPFPIRVTPGARP